MARIGLIASFVLLVSISVFAQKVVLEEAKKIAENYLLMKKGTSLENTLTVSNHYIKHNEAGDVLYYIFNFESGGFVLVAGDKRISPILAYSTTNSFLVDENHPAYVFVDAYEKGIEHIKATVYPADISPKWNDIAAGKQRKVITTQVGPLLTCKWDQNKYYNTLCPDDDKSPNGYDNHVPNGCVALAMAQIMYYHRFPRQGSGSSSYNSNYGKLTVNHAATTYDYESMVDVAENYSDAIARLIFHIGVSLEMGYKPDGSGVPNSPQGTQRILNTLRNKFRYSTSDMISGGNYPGNNISWWRDTIRQSLDKGLPVYYDACRDKTTYPTDGCHAFVCDGYEIDDEAVNDDNKFHFNFGWGGGSDGFWTLSLAMAGFVLDNGIILNITPNDLDTANFFKGRKTLTATYGSFNDGSGRLNYRPNTDCEWLISPQKGKNINSITLISSWFSLEEGDTVKIYQGNTKNTLLHTLTGDSVGKSYTITASEALVVFTSSATSTGEGGFVFNYTSNKTSNNYCNIDKNKQRITTPNSSIDNGSGTNMYDSDNECFWAIAPQGMTNEIKFAFSKFDLERGDVLEVYATTDANINAMTWSRATFTSAGKYRFSLDNKPKLNEIITVSAPTVLFRFRTDNNLNGTGFRIYWNDSMNVNTQDYISGLAKLSVYPNPANDIICIDLHTDTEENIQINLCDILGSSLYSASKQQVFGEHQERINVSNFANGLYFLRIETSKCTVTKKVAIR